jgi:hypothetical protein
MLVGLAERATVGCWLAWFTLTVAEALACCPVELVQVML